MMTNGIFSKNEWAEISKKLSFSKQQSNIARLLLDDLGDKQIAMELGICVPTLRTYIGRMFSKYNVTDRVGLILYIFKEFHKDCQKCECARLGFTKSIVTNSEAQKRMSSV